jgi:hypothetical protein
MLNLSIKLSCSIKFRSTSDPKLRVTQQKNHSCTTACFTKINPNNYLTLNETTHYFKDGVAAFDGKLIY